MPAILSQLSLTMPLTIKVLNYCPWAIYDVFSNESRSCGASMGSLGNKNFLFMKRNRLLWQGAPFMSARV